MDEFEKQLQDLPLRRPREGLRRRIFQARRTRRPGPRVFAVRVPLAWAALLMAAAGLVGFGAARLTEPLPRAVLVPGPSTVEVRIIEAQPQRPLFDFTETTMDFLPGDFEVQVETNGEV